YRAHKRGAVAAALKRAGVTAEVLEPISVPPHSRRRAVFKFANGEIGFHAVQSHTVVDMRECLVLTPGLFGLVQHLRTRLAFLKESAEIHITESLTGFDLAVRSPQKLNATITAHMAEAAAGLNIARITFNAALVLENAAPEVD